MERAEPDDERRRTVLLIPNSFGWIAGHMASAIAATNRDDFEFLFFSTERLRRGGPAARQELTELVARSDLVHLLDPYFWKQWAVPLDRPTIAPVFHVIDWSQDAAPNLAADLVHTIAPEWRAALEDRGVSPDGVVMRPLGVDTRWFRPLRRRGPFRARGVDGFVVGFFSNLATDAGGRKGIPTLIAALSEFGLHHPVTLTLTGFGWEDRVSEMRAKGVDVAYHRFVSRRALRRLYNCLDVYVVAAEVEGGPSPLLEAMACGTAVVTTAVGVVPLAVEHGVTGVIVPKRDPRALAAALSDLAAHPAERRALGEAARRRVVDRLDDRISYGHMAEIYSRALTRGHRRLGTAPAPVPISRRWARQQRATVQADDELLYLLRRPHPVSALRDVLAPIGALVAVGRPDRSAALALRAIKFEVVGRSPALRSWARGRRRRASGGNPPT